MTNLTKTKLKHDLTDDKKGFTGLNCRPISILPVLTKLCEKMACNKTIYCFSRNGLLGYLITLYMVIEVMVTAWL